MDNVEECKRFANRDGRTYIVSLGGQLLKAQDTNGRSTEPGRVTKVIIPKSSSESIKALMHDAGRYVQRSNNTSMSIRDFVEAKGRKGRLSNQEYEEETVNICRFV